MIPHGGPNPCRARENNSASAVSCDTENSNHWAKEMTVHGWVGKYNSGQEFNERGPVKNAVEVLFGVLAGEQLCAAVGVFSLSGPLR